MVLSLTPNHLADLCPPETGTRRMRACVGLNICVVSAMGRDPLVGRILHRHCRKDRQEVFQPFRRLKTAMGQKTMPAEPNSETSDNPIADQQNQEVLPTECKNYRYCE